MSSFNNAGLGGGPFSGGNADGLKGGIQAAMKVMQQNSNQQDHMPTEATPEVIDAAAKEASTAMTIHDKNKIINKHISIDINENLTFEEFKKLTEKKALEKDYPDINK